MGSPTSRTRRFLMLCMGGLPALALLPRAALSSIAGRSSGDVAAMLRATVADHEAARRLGRLYVRVTPDESDPQLLVRRALGWPEGVPLDAAAWDREELIQRLEARVHDDFATGATVRLDGWVLSRTEARLCALCR